VSRLFDSVPTLILYLLFKLILYAFSYILFGTYFSKSIPIITSVLVTSVCVGCDFVFCFSEFCFVGFVLVSFVLRFALRFVLRIRSLFPFFCCGMNAHGTR
jgi:hypothetical protein